MSEAQDPVCGRQSDHDFVDNVCSKCGTTWLESVRGFGSATSNYEMPPSKRARRAKSARHNRILQAMGQDE